MDDKESLLLKSNARSGWMDTIIKLSIFALLYGCASEIRTITETQFVYDYLKKNHNDTDANNTYVIHELHESSKKAQNCFTNSTGGTDDHIQGLAADWTWYIELITYGLAVIVLIILGPLSDNIGRKPVLVYNLLFTAISFGLRAFVVYADLGLNWYLLFCGIEGISGGTYLFNMACCTMLSNCTSPNGERPFMLSVFNAMLGFGMTFSQIAAGYLIKAVGFTLPYVISSGLMFIVCICLLCTLTESKKRSTIKKSTLATSIFTFCTQPDAVIKDKRKLLFVYYLIFVLHVFPIASTVAIKILFTLGFPFCWSSVHIGWYYAGENFLELVLSTFILKMLLLCMTLETVTIIGFITTIASFIMFGFSTSDWMIYGATAVGVIWILPVPLLKSIMSRIVHPNKHGTLFANIYLLEVLCQLGGSTVFNNIYHQTRPIFKGLVFFVMAGFPLCALFIMAFVICKESSGKQATIYVDEPTVQESNYSSEEKLIEA